MLKNVATGFIDEANYVWLFDLTSYNTVLNDIDLSLSTKN